MEQNDHECFEMLMEEFLLKNNLEKPNAET